MANDFSGDADCMALYDFESGNLTVDSKGGNTLTNNGAVGEDLINFRQGACSADFTPNDWFHIINGNLDANFPMKSGDANKKISVTFWIRFDAKAAWNTIVAMWNTGAAKREFRMGLGGAGNRFALDIGYAGGALGESKLDSTVVVGNGKWYHVGITFQDSDKSYRIRIFDEDAATTTETTGNFTNNINVEDADFEIGRYTAWGYINGRVDEVVVFKDILSAGEIDEIRQGIYGAGVVAPTVTTQAVSNIAATTATGNGNITDTGGEACHTRGICWSTNPNPTTADDKAEDDGGGAYGTGAFAKVMTGLTPGQHYYVRAYAINSEGTSYGADVEFDAATSAHVVDITYLTPTSGFIWYQKLGGANYADDDVLDNGGGDEITVNGTPAVDPTFYEQGEIEMTSGDNNGQQRPIALDAAGVITALWPFVSAIGIGDDYKVYPGCDLRGITCHHKFHNEDVFRGFLYVPRTEDAIM